MTIGLDGPAHARIQLHGGPHGAMNAEPESGPPCQLQRFVRQPGYNPHRDFRDVAIAATTVNKKQKKVSSDN